MNHAHWVKKMSSIKFDRRFLPIHPLLAVDVQKCFVWSLLNATWGPACVFFFITSIHQWILESASAFLHFHSHSACGEEGVLSLSTLLLLFLCFTVGMLLLFYWFLCVSVSCSLILLVWVEMSESIWFVGCCVTFSSLTSFHGCGDTRTNFTLDQCSPPQLNSRHLGRERKIQLEWLYPRRTSLILVKNILSGWCQCLTWKGSLVL